MSMIGKPERIQRCEVSPEYLWPQSVEILGDLKLVHRCFSMVGEFEPLGVWFEGQ